MKAATKAEKQRMATISRTPCIVCFLYLDMDTPAEVHHLIDTGRRLGHNDTIPLCFPHHREGTECEQYVSVHPFNKEFHARYGSNSFLLEETNKIIMEY